MAQRGECGRHDCGRSLRGAWHSGESAAGMAAGGLCEVYQKITLIVPKIEKIRAEETPQLTHYQRATKKCNAED